MGLEMLFQIFELCIVPLLAVLTAYLVQWIRAKTAEATEKNQKDVFDKYITMLGETIAKCVSATNQTYVDALKKAGSFDAEAQKHAFDMTLTAVMSVLGKDAIEYLTAIYGDLTGYLTTLIEAEVKSQKTGV
jgi:hypothetical protein